MTQDIIAPKDVEIVISHDSKSIWINVEGVCKFRACQIEKLYIDDRRQNMSEPNATDIELLIARIAEAERENDRLRAAYDDVRALNVEIAFEHTNHILRAKQIIERLANEIDGIQVFETAIREVISNTNYNALIQRMKEARAFLEGRIQK